MFFITKNIEYHIGESELGSKRGVTKTRMGSSQH